MTSHNTCGTNLCTRKSNACADCRGCDCNSSNFTDCEIAETDTDSNLNEEDDFNNESIFEKIFGEF